MSGFCGLDEMKYQWLCSAHEADSHKNEKKNQTTKLSLKIVLNLQTWGVYLSYMSLCSINYLIYLILREIKKKNVKFKVSQGKSVCIESPLKHWLVHTRSKDHLEYLVNLCLLPLKFHKLVYILNLKFYFYLMRFSLWLWGIIELLPACFTIYNHNLHSFIYLLTF